MTPRDYAILAQAAYTAIPDIGISTSAARVVINHISQMGEMVLAIPGTNNLSCLEADLDALTLDAGPFGFVHRGIWQAFAEVWSEVSKLSPDVLCGHSEGAAGAIYLGAQLCIAGRPPKAIYAFEPPRTSIDEALRIVLKYHNVDVNIYHHGRDIVPLVPMPIPGENWQHAGDVTQFGTPSGVIPNFQDHAISGVIADLSVPL